MRVNVKKYFEEAHKAGLTPFSLSYGFSKSFSVSTFNGEVEEQKIGISQSIGGRALYQGKVGYFSSDAIDDSTPALMAEAIKESALFGKEEKAENFYHGGKPYRKVKIDAKAFVPATLKELREAALALQKKVSAYDPRITKAEIDFAMDTSEFHKRNDVGMKCQEKRGTFVGSITVVCENEKKEPRTGYRSFYSFTSLADLVAKGEKEIEKAVHAAVDFFGTGALKGKDYKTVLSPDVVSILLPYLLSQCNAKKVHKHLSIYEGKLGTQVTSKHLTLLHTPHAPSIASSSFDGDGVPTQDFPIIQRGVLKNYFYSLETANEEHIESNGCASGNGNGSFITLTVKPGKKNLDALFAQMKKGIYLTSVSGTNTGIDDQSLFFSLPCEGYVIEDGKKAGAFSMTIASGNLKDLFNDVVAVGSDSEDEDGVFTPSLLVKKIHYAGK